MNTVDLIQSNLNLNNTLNELLDVPPLDDEYSEWLFDELWVEDNED